MTAADPRFRIWPEHDGSASGATSRGPWSVRDTANDHRKVGIYPTKDAARNRAAALNEETSHTYRAKRGDNTASTPFVTNWYVVDERGRSGMEHLPRHLRRGHDRKREAQASADRRNAHDPVPGPDAVGQLTEADRRVLARIAAFGSLTVAKDAKHAARDHVPEEQARRLEAHGKAVRQDRTFAMPGGKRYDYQALVLA